LGAAADAVQRGALLGKNREISFSIFSRTILKIKRKIGFFFLFFCFFVFLFFCFLVVKPLRDVPADEGVRFRDPVALG
jgi:hypothetical protein